MEKFDGFKHHTYPGEQKANRVERRLPDDPDAADGLSTTRYDLNLSPEVYDKIENGDYTFATEYLCDVLADVDEEVLIDIFKKELGRSGGDIDTINFISLNDIDPNYSEDALGTHNTIDNVLKINIPVIASLLEGGADDSDVKLEILMTLIHEETHAVSHSTCIETVSKQIQESGEVVLRSTRSGYVKSSESYIPTIDGGWVTLDAQQTHVRINEGVTELIAQRVLHQYNKKAPLRDTTKEQRDAFEQTLLRYNGSAYARDVYTVKCYIALIAAATGVPRDVVENGVIRSYLRGSDLVSDDMLSLMDEFLGEDMGLFLQTMSENNDSTIDFENALLQADLKIPDVLLEKLRSELLGTLSDPIPKSSEDKTT